MLPRIWNNFWGRNLADQGSADILILFGLQEVLIYTWWTFSTGDTWKRRYLHYIPENCRLSTIWRPLGPIRDEIENQDQAMLRKVVSSMSSRLMELIRHRGKQIRQWSVFWKRTCFGLTLMRLIFCSFDFECTFSKVEIRQFFWDTLYVCFSLRWEKKHIWMQSTTVASHSASRLVSTLPQITRRFSTETAIHKTPVSHVQLLCCSKSASNSHMNWEHATADSPSEETASDGKNNTESDLDRTLVCTSPEADSITGSVESGIHKTVVGNIQMLHYLT